MSTVASSSLSSSLPSSSSSSSSSSSFSSSAGLGLESVIVVDVEPTESSSTVSAPGSIPPNEEKARGELVSSSHSPQLHRFASMPNELVGEIMSYLSAQDLCRAAQTCRDLYADASSPIVWMDLFARDFDVAPSDLQLLRVNPKESYKYRVQRRLERLTVVQEQRISQQSKRVAAWRQVLLLTILRLGTLFSILFAPILLTLAFFAQAARRLDGDVLQSWWEVASPLWVALGLIFLWLGLCTLVDACIRARAGRADSYCYGLRTVPNKLYFPISLTQQAAESDIFTRRARGARCGIWLCGMVLLALLACPILVIAKFNSLASDAALEDAAATPTIVGNETIIIHLPITEPLSSSFLPWRVVLVPLWLLFSLSCCTLMPCLVKVHKNYLGALLGFWCTVGWPLFAYFILLCVNEAQVAAGKDSPLQPYEILMPIWIFFGIIVLLLLVMLLVGVVQMCCRQRDFGEALVAAGLVFLVSLCTLPPLLSLILAAQRLQHEGGWGSAATSDDGVALLPWKNILAPTIFWFAVILCAVVGACIYLVFWELLPSCRAAQRKFRQGTDDP